MYVRRLMLNMKAEPLQHMVLYFEKGHIRLKSGCPVIPEQTKNSYNVAVFSR